MSWSNVLPVLLALTLPVAADRPYAGPHADDRSEPRGGTVASSSPVVSDRLLHTTLDHTIPADGDTLASAPDSLVLVFTGGLEELGSDLTLIGPDDVPRPLEHRVTSGGAQQRVDALLPELVGGAYTVEWRVLSLDGHPVEGSFSFVVDIPSAPVSSTGPSGAAGRGGDSAGAAPDGGTKRPEPSAASDSPGAGGDSRENSDTGWGLIVVTGLAHLSIMGLAGLLLFAARGTESPSAATLRTGLALAVVAALAAPLQAWMWAGEALGAGAGVGERTSGLLTLTSGRPQALRAALSISLLGVLALGGRTGIAAALAVLAVGAGGFGGHVVTTSSGWAQPLNGIHLLAVAAWGGGLLFILTERRSAHFSVAVRRVSSVALVCAAVVPVTGALQAWLLVESPSALLESRYGVLVLAKVAGLLALVAFGAAHRLKTIPSVIERSETGPIVRTVRMELVVAGAVVLLATLLAHTPLP